MKTLVFVSNSFGSLYNFRQELICQMAEQYRVVIVTPMNDEDYALYETWKARGIFLEETFLSRRGKNPLQEGKLIQQYRRLLERIKPDLVITYTIKPNIYAGMACHRLGIPFFANITGLGSAFQGNGILRLLSAFLYRKSLKNAEVVFMQNKEIESVFHKYGIRGKKMILVPGSGINLEKFRVLPYPEENANRFLYIARIMKEKGAEEFFYAAEQLKMRCPQACFDVVGFCEETYEEKLKDLETRGVIKYHGWQTDVRMFLQKAGCVVQPSYHEGLSNVCLEAAAAGRPLLVSDIPGCRETVNEGLSGFVFPPGDKTALLDCMERFCRLDYAEKTAMGVEGRKKMEKEFDRKKVVLVYREQIERIFVNEGNSETMA
ncbi:MAG: glycosyltransferase family 4 protein [Lachnospiraceae bacterium]|nr:glycosyltransferase family 4 protein [Lachnospiraceae bacterium]